MFVPADVALAQVVAKRAVWWLRPRYVKRWRYMAVTEKVQNYEEAVRRLDTLRQKHTAREVEGFLRYLRWQETGSILVAHRDVARLLQTRTGARLITPVRRAEILRPGLRKWRILLIKSTGYELHEITRDLKRRGFPAYELRKVLPR